MPSACIAELAARAARCPAHTNRVVGFAKDETVLAAGDAITGLYILVKGKVAFERVSARPFR